MKLIGEYTMRGVMPVENTWNRITLFDGRFDTGFRVVEFKIMPVNVKTAANDVTGKLATDDSASDDGGIWNWDDNREIAWCSSEVRVSFGPSFTNEVIDPDHLIIEDLYACYGHPSTDSPVNYFLRLEKYDISEYQGAMAMVRARSQG